MSVRIICLLFLHIDNFISRFECVDRRKDGKFERFMSFFLSFDIVVPPFSSFFYMEQQYLTRIGNIFFLSFFIREFSQFKTEPMHLLASS